MAMNIGPGANPYARAPVRNVPAPRPVARRPATAQVPKPRATSTRGNAPIPGNKPSTQGTAPIPAPQLTPDVTTTAPLPSGTMQVPGLDSTAGTQQPLANPWGQLNTGITNVMENPYANLGSATTPGTIADPTMNTMPAIPNPNVLQDPNVNVWGQSTAPYPEDRGLLTPMSYGSYDPIAAMQSAATTQAPTAAPTPTSTMADPSTSVPNAGQGKPAGQQTSVGKQGRSRKQGNVPAPAPTPAPKGWFPGSTASPQSFLPTIAQQGRNGQPIGVGKANLGDMMRLAGFKPRNAKDIARFRRAWLQNDLTAGGGGADGGASAGGE